MQTPFEHVHLGVAYQNRQVAAIDNKGDPA